jgi:hypothetical protein
MATTAPTAPRIVSPTNAPTIDDVFQGSVELRFSTYARVPVEEQEPVLKSILNLAICSTGLRLVTTTYKDACPSSRMVQPVLGVDEPTVAWNEPLVAAEWISKDIWRWNYTYHAIRSGNQTNAVLQGFLDKSILEGHLDQALPWPSSRAIVFGGESAFLPRGGIPSRSATALRAIGSALLLLSIAGVAALTILARRRRMEKGAHSLDAMPPELACRDDTDFPDGYPEQQEGHVEDKQQASLEAMLFQSRQYAATNGPASLLNAGFPVRHSDQASDDSLEDDDDDDVMLGLAGITSRQLPKVDLLDASLDDTCGEVEYNCPGDGRSFLEGEKNVAPSSATTKDEEVVDILSSPDSAATDLKVTAPSLSNTSDDTDDDQAKAIEDQRTSTL